jgi:hypothetical protein
VAPRRAQPAVSRKTFAKNSNVYANSDLDAIVFCWGMIIFLITLEKKPTRLPTNSRQRRSKDEHYGNEDPMEVHEVRLHHGRRRTTRNLSAVPRDLRI